MADEKKPEVAEGSVVPPDADVNHEPMYYYDEPEIPEVLPDQSWSTDRLIEAATKDENMLVRSNAVGLLGSRKGKDVVEALILALKDEDYIVRSNAMVKLAEMGHEALDRVIEAVDDADEAIRAGAAWILGEIKDQKAVKCLEKAAKDDKLFVRVQAKASLIALGIIKGTKSEEKS